MEDSVIKDDLGRYTRMFFDADEAARDERGEAHQARDYFDGKQYTDEELEILKRRKQPPVRLNRVSRKINHLLGLEVERRTDPKAWPRTMQDEQAAQAATDSLRYVEQTINLDNVLSRMHENMLIEGYGGIELVVEPDGEEYAINAVHWEYDRLFYDPHSIKHDFSDATYLGGVEWLDLDEAKEMWPGKDGLFDVSSLGGTITDEYDDQPEKKSWITRGARPRVRIIHMYHRMAGKWYLCQFTGSGILDQKPVPFVDDKGRSFCPLFMESAYVDRDGDRYGEVRNLISPQDLINKTHSKLQHLISVRQIIAEEGAIDEKYGGVDGARQELAKPDGVIIKNPGMELEIVSTADIAAGHASLIQEFKNEMDLMGPNASMQGKGPQSQSGRALMAQTQGGMREFNPVADRFTSLKERVYRAIWNLIRQYWTAPKWIRVTDDERNLKFVGLNRPVTRLETAMRKAQEMGMDPNAVKQQIASHPQFSQLAGEVVDVENNVAKMDVDIIIETGPDMVTLQAEQFEQLSMMVQAGVQIPPEVLIEASGLRNKDQLIEKMRGGDNPQAQAMLQAQQQLQMRGAEAEIAGKEANAAKDAADAQKTQIEAMKLLYEPVANDIPA